VTPIQANLEELASAAPAPDGGAAAALTGAQGVALLSMVCRLTVEGGCLWGDAGRFLNVPTWLINA